jgi:hypothetical protein
MDALAVGEGDVTLMLVAAFEICLDVVAGQGIHAAFCVVTETYSCGENGTTGINAQADVAGTRIHVIRTRKTPEKRAFLPILLTPVSSGSPKNSLRTPLVVSHHG